MVGVIVTQLNLSNYFGLIQEKIEVLIRIGECFKAHNDFHNSEKMLRKALEYAWLMNNDHLELLIYDKLGIVHYILGDVEKADYYHKRFSLSHLESRQSPAYKVAVENVHDTWDYIKRNKAEKFYFKMLNNCYLLQNMSEPELT